MKLLKLILKAKLADVTKSLDKSGWKDVIKD